MALFSASIGDQYRVTYPEKKHCLFMYFLLKGLRRDVKCTYNKITLDELYKYINNNVSESQDIWVKSRHKHILEDISLEYY